MVAKSGARGLVDPRVPGRQAIYPDYHADQRHQDQKTGKAVRRKDRITAWDRCLQDCQIIRQRTDRNVIRLRHR